MIRKAIGWLNAHHFSARLLVSVVIGIGTGMALTLLTHEILHLCGVFPPLSEPMFDTKLVTIDLIYHSIYAVMAAIVTARVAQEKANKAVFALGTKEAIMWIIGMILLWKHNPAWYNLTKALLGIPLALLGGWIFRKFLKKPNAKRWLKILDAK